ncbi:tRNA pseudouridine(55) synthase TruB [Buchnera aphidicola]|uniref:tRNA pseudouridine(55) synthase TruB n=1 Tax=Buchnera aphidicola TaxID=9 RepID=UPI00094D8C10|nr:tRNA pseudouridine(55) synthase TruB [Buchnera aphidicola]
MDDRNYNSYNGILLLDKPKGISSNGALQQVKNIFLAKKAGYTGSLDPLATGMLPILFGKVTKFSKYLTNSIKKYHVIAKLGEVTTTGDASGQILYTRSIQLHISEIIKILNTFLGKIQQVPPMFSAIKYQGIPLYKYARLGICIPRSSRNVIIYQLNCIQFISGFLELTVICSKGTYIRSLVEDIGKKLTCGAHVVFLRRLKVGSYNSSQLVTFSDLYFVENKNIHQIHKFYLPNMLSAFLLPVSSFFLECPQIKLNNVEAKSFKKNLSIFLCYALKASVVRVVTGKKNTFLGIGKINELCFLIPECIFNL